MRVYMVPECAPICGFRHPDKSANGVSTIEARCKTPGCCNAPSSRNAVAVGSGQECSRVPRVFVFVCSALSSSFFLYTGVQTPS